MRRKRRRKGVGRWREEGGQEEGEGEGGPVHIHPPDISSKAVAMASNSVDKASNSCNTYKQTHMYTQLSSSNS